MTDRRQSYLRFIYFEKTLVEVADLNAKDQTAPLPGLRSFSLRFLLLSCCESFCSCWSLCRTEVLGQGGRKRQSETLCVVLFMSILCTLPLAVRIASCDFRNCNSAVFIVFKVHFYSVRRDLSMFAISAIRLQSNLFPMEKSKKKQRIITNKLRR